MIPLWHITPLCTEVVKTRGGKIEYFRKITFSGSGEVDCSNIPLLFQMRQTGTDSGQRIFAIAECFDDLHNRHVVVPEDALQDVLIYMGECIWYARLLWLWGSRFHARDSTKNTPSPASGRGETTKQPHPDCHALTQISMVSYPPFTISSHRIRIFEKPFIEQQAGNLTFPASRGKSADAPLSFFVAGPAEPEAILLCC